MSDEFKLGGVRQELFMAMDRPALRELGYDGTMFAPWNITGRVAFDITDLLPNGVTNFRPVVGGMGTVGIGQ